jgi:hypothetical protein
MRALLIGLVAAAALGAAAPASAQEFRFRAPGVDVDVGGGPRHYREDRRYRRGPDRAYGYRSSGCRTVTIEREDGSVRRIRRCG